MYTVKEASSITGLTEHAIRFYTDKGLVPTIKRNEHNVRLFDEMSINWLHGVRCLKQSGMPIESIKRYIDLCLQGEATLFERSEIMRQHGEFARAQLEEAKRHVRHLEEKVKLYEEISAGRQPDTMNPGNWEEMQVMHGDVFYKATSPTT
ncbi:MerR family transcriptional regulator [Saccharibacillus sp. JS10]|uniref:MerR family transcriptional regulator n=1 Tax=Saccharibacillus sp. JS10 TaxID=2950552 RepID=UPI00210E8BC5|nr:MerR family transcriptional regulator [Saccharibacillus sp. JS10]MCQ4085679.1 MerR family transcriptional regulator [Saccharibacillus sp. JS10]